MGDFGQMLRQERERRGIALEDLARAAKVGRHHLEALESNDLARLPGGPFNKGFVRAYARHLGLDPEQAVDAYTREERAQGLRSPDADRELPSASVPFLELRAEGDRQTLVVDWLRLRRLALLVAVGLGAVAVLWLVLGPSGPEPAVVAAATTPAPTQPEAALPAAPPAALARNMPPLPAPGEPAGAVPGQSAGPAPAPADTKPPSPAGGGSLQITDAAVGIGLDGHDLEEQADRFREGEQAWFWTRSTGGRRGQALRHVWLREGRAIATYELTVGGPHWRNASRKTLSPGSAGAWTVEARDAAGRTLARAEFVCLPARTQPR